MPCRYLLVVWIVSGAFVGVWAFWMAYLRSLMPNFPPMQIWCEWFGVFICYERVLSRWNFKIVPILKCILNLIVKLMKITYIRDVWRNLMLKLWFNFLSKIITFIWTKICLVLKFLAFFLTEKHIFVSKLPYFCVFSWFLRIVSTFFSAEWTVFLLFFLILLFWGLISAVFRH